MHTRARNPPLDVSLRTVEVVRRLLERSRIPVSRYWLLDRLRAAGHPTTPPRLDRALSFFFDLDLAVEGSQGIQWTHARSPSLQHAVFLGRQV